MSTATAQVLDRIMQHHRSVRPGLPARFTKAASVGDRIWQGDLGIQVVDRIPKGYSLCRKPKHRLTPMDAKTDDTIGSRHALDSLQGVEVYYPKGWPASAEKDFLGPVLVLSEERVITHPTHGDVTCPAGTYRIFYQKVWDQIQKRIRRQRD